VPSEEGGICNREMLVTVNLRQDTNDRGGKRSEEKKSRFQKLVRPKGCWWNSCRTWCVTGMGFGEEGVFSVGWGGRARRKKKAEGKISRGGGGENQAYVRWLARGSSP